MFISLMGNQSGWEESGKAMLSIKAGAGGGIAISLNSRLMNVR